MVAAIFAVSATSTPSLTGHSMIIYSQKYYNKYHKIIKHYKELDLKRSNELYTENHHILPKCYGGLDVECNLVRVPARVHFLLHWMLYRIYKTPGMAHAWNMMCCVSTNHIRYNAKSFECARRAGSFAAVHSLSGKKLSKTHRDNISKGGKGRIFSAEHKARLTISNTGRPVSAETREKIRAGNKGKTLTKDQIASIHKIVTCPHCNKIGNISNMKRWHFDNCKLKSALLQEEEYH